MSDGVLITNPDDALRAVYGPDGDYLLGVYMQGSTAGLLVAWERVKEILTLDEDLKSRVEFLIASATSQAEKYAGRILGSRDVSIILDSPGGRELLLPGFPVNRVTDIRIDFHSRTFEAKHIIPPEEYGVRKDSGIVRFYRRSLPREWDCIQFTGNIGYDPVPEDLQQGVIETVSANLRRLSSSGGQIGIKTVTENGAVNTSYEIEMPLSARKIFESYGVKRV